MTTIRLFLQSAIVSMLLLIPSVLYSQENAADYVKLQDGTVLNGTIIPLETITVVGQDQNTVRFINKSDITEMKSNSPQLTYVLFHDPDGIIDDYDTSREKTEYYTGEDLDLFKVKFFNSEKSKNLFLIDELGNEDLNSTYIDLLKNEVSKCREDVIPLLKTKMLKVFPDKQQIGAARAAGALEANELTESLIEMLFASDSKPVRLEAAQAIRDIEKETPDELINVLDRASPRKGVIAAEAIGEIQDFKGLDVLVNVAANGGRGWRAPGAWIGIFSQTAYVRDFTLLVSVAAVGADPEIGYVQSGISYEVRPLQINIYRTIVSYVADKSFKNKEEMEKWWNENKDSFK